MIRFEIHNRAAPCAFDTEVFDVPPYAVSPTATWLAATERARQLIDENGADKIRIFRLEAGVEPREFSLGPDGWQLVG